MPHEPDDLGGESREWEDAITSVIAFEGTARADQLLTRAVDTARRAGAHLPFAANTAYIDTIATNEQATHPGDRAIEHRIRSAIRWNAMAIVLEANKTSSELGGHIASFQSAATLVGNGVATVVVSKWEGGLDEQRMQRHLNNETTAEAESPEQVLVEDEIRAAGAMKPLKM